MLSQAVRVPDNLKASLLIGLLALLVYNANLRSISAGDTYPARYLPFAVWHDHTVLLDSVSDSVAQGRMIPRIPRGTPFNHNNSPIAFWILQLPGGHTVSLYPLVTPLLVTPLYLPAVAYLSATGWDQQQMDRLARIMEKLAASLMAAASVTLLYILLRRRTARRWAIALTCAYAFGTTTWVVSSQALWQHGAGELLIVLALLLLTSPCTPGRAAAAGLVLGLIACNRPPDSIIAAALSLYGLWWARRLAALMVAGALLPAIPLLIYNLGVVGNLAGAYGLVGKPSFFDHDVFSGLAGLLVSPTRGLFVFCPFLLFVPLFLRRVIADTRTRGLTIAVLVAVALQLVLYAKADWRQGASWGPRWLTDLVPLLVWMLPPVVDSLSRTARALFVAACTVAILIEAIGAFWYTGASDAAILAVMKGPGQYHAAWMIPNAPFIAELGHPAPPAELLADVRGFLDVLTVSDGINGRQIDLAGWALASGHSPWEVSAVLDGGLAVSTTTFLARPDVSKTFGVRDPTGWQITIPARDLSAGEHLVAIGVRAFEGGELRLLTERRFTVQAPPARSAVAAADPAGSATRAAQILVSHQQQPGYWLTSYTGHPRFEGPKQEMNTYLTAVIVDLLNPVVSLAGLQPSVSRARSFLTAQIEPDGLVRYHGLPDAPTIGTLGCVITPDSDDTSLVWRIAPGDNPELRRAALATMNAYRTPEGFYRTWLAPPNRFRCINPGKDPDPADIGIQMHVFQLLVLADRGAASTLCRALNGAVDDDRVWVYYRHAPLIPMLRQADLQESGCSLRLPPEREKTTVAGQELWISAIRMLLRMRGIEGQRPVHDEVRDLLAKLAGDDFAVVSQSPPLLYHNDDTASLPRFYWSDDFGYALWLRLYYEDANRPGGGHAK